MNSITSKFQSRQVSCAKSLYLLVLIINRLESGDLLRDYTNSFHEWFPSNYFSLIYKASRYNLLRKLRLMIIRDGFAAEEFHRHCDNKGPTLTIIKEKDGGHLFGGFISGSWEAPSTAVYKKNSSAFIFTLSNPHNIPPTRYFPKDNRESFGCRKGWGPNFFDVRVEANANSNAYSFSCFPCHYTDTTGKGRDTLFLPAVKGEHACFSVAEIEVYSVL